ncbi:unnamed protein product, partial [Ilex paraguariensis]
MPCRPVIKPITYEAIDRGTDKLPNPKRYSNMLIIYLKSLLPVVNGISETASSSETIEVDIS